MMICGGAAVYLTQRLTWNVQLRLGHVPRPARSLLWKPLEGALSSFDNLADGQHTGYINDTQGWGDRLILFNKPSDMAITN